MMLNAHAHIRRFAAAVGALLALMLSGGAAAETAANLSSAVGINLQPVSYYSSELPFLNIFKTANAWITHGTTQFDTNEEAYLNLDANGWPITLTTINDSSPQQFTSVGVLLLRNLPATANGYYPAGQYVVLYQGQGTLSYGLDASLVSSTPGRDVINVPNPTSGGIDIRISVTDPSHSGNYIRNIQLVQLGNEALLNSGQVFNPTFLGLLKNFRTLRFMDWLATNNNTLSSWANRPLQTYAFWGTASGVPLEVAIQLANAVSADAWLNVPIMADTNYMTQMATLVNGLLGSTQKAYVEYSNEVWNGGFSQNAYSIAQGHAMFPGALNQYYAGWEWYGMRVAQMADIWYGVYSATAFNNRVVMVMAGQAADTAVLTEELSTPDWTGTGNGPASGHHIGALAIAPYFFSIPSSTDLSSMLASSDGGLSELLGTAYAQNGYSSVPAGGQIAQASGWVANHAALANTYNLPLVAYEGGQTLVGSPTYSSGSPQVNLLISANRDPRMNDIYTSYLNSWRSSGGTLFLHYTDSFPFTQFGEWGLLESTMQTTFPLTSAPAKWQATQKFIANNSCWWAGCAGTLSGSTAFTTPMPPTKLTVH